MRNERSRTGLIIGILLLVIGLLVMFLVYAFVVRPQITGYVIDRQIEAQSILISNIITQVQQQGFVQIPINNNQSIFLAPFNPQQEQQQQQPPQ